MCTPQKQLTSFGIIDYDNIEKSPVAIKMQQKVQMARIRFFMYKFFTNFNTSKSLRSHFVTKYKDQKNKEQFFIDMFDSISKLLTKNTEETKRFDTLDKVRSILPQPFPIQVAAGTSNKHHKKKTSDC